MLPGPETTKSVGVTPSPVTLRRDRQESPRQLRAGPALAWFDTARLVDLALYLPTLALTEVRAVRPDSAPLLADVLGHSSVLLGELNAVAADQVDQLLTDVDVFDALAGHVVHIAWQRGWPALIADPDRLHPINPTLEVHLL